MRRSREADITDVLNKIIRRIRDSELAKKLGQKVLDYYRSKDPKKDLSLSESRLIYRDDDYGDTRSLSKKREVDIGWTDHAEYRSDLRDIDRKDVNQTIVERLRNKLRKPDSKKIKFKEPGVGTMVVDYDLRKDPAQADVVTVWAADETMNRITEEGIMSNKRIAKPRLELKTNDDQYGIWIFQVFLSGKLIGEKHKKSYIDTARGLGKGKKSPGGKGWSPYHRRTKDQLPIVAATVYHQPEFTKEYGKKSYTIVWHTKLPTTKGKDLYGHDGKLLKEFIGVAKEKSGRTGNQRIASELLKVAELIAKI